MEARQYQASRQLPDGATATGVRRIENERNLEYTRQYRQQIEAYLRKNYARMLTTQEAEQRGDRTWFLPHFAVQNVNKPGRFRLFFYAAGVAHGTSLNAALLAGPDVNVPLTRLLFQFRMGAVGVCADVREMYRERFGAAQSSEQTIVLEPVELTQKILGMTWETSDDSFRF